jgi:hypothetical protein
MSNQIDSPTGVPKKDAREAPPPQQVSAEQGEQVSKTVRKVSESKSSHAADEPTGAFTTSHGNP